MVVERLGALCQLGSDSGDSRSFSVHEFAEMSDGERIVLHRDRGWSESTHIAPGSNFDFWRDAGIDGTDRCSPAEVGRVYCEAPAP